ncbi:hypothetical protein ACFVIM_28005 [Streptomyces sp. NPDC057638]|uniref:hypothetical protein n=1 Tax=Streptomyces sp. NPDC057638 TaxID=3346190 RepID=UPI0036B5643F
MHTPGDASPTWRPPSEVRNTVRDSTVEYLVQAGHVQGDLVVNLPPTRSPADDAAEALARSVRAQWSAEVAARELGATEGALAVRWLARWGPSTTVRTGSGPPTTAGGASGPPTTAGTGSGPSASVGAGTGDAVRADRADGITETLLGLDIRRLTVLGGPGSGKSTLLALVTVALADRHLGDITRGLPGQRGVPVPVLLTLESWDAERVAFLDWLTARIAEDHPGLPLVNGVHPARHLVRDGRVLAVLDGLDELPPHRRVAVVRALNTSHHGTGCVLASRVEEYRALGTRLTASSDIEALPVRPRDAAAHLLRTAGPSRHDAWGPVVDELAERPEGPLARTLTSPLMLWLARRAYGTAGSDPGELVEPVRFGEREAVEVHLLDAIVPAVFAPGPHDSERLYAPGRWHPGRARGWLGFLARELGRRDTTEFGWWRLRRSAVARLLTLPTLLAAGVLLTEAVLVLTRAVAETTGEWSLAVERGYLTGGFLMAFAVRNLVILWSGERLWEPRRRANPLRAGAALRSVSRSVAAVRGLRTAATLIIPNLLFLLISLGVGGENADAFIAQFLLGFTVTTLLTLVLAAPADTVDAATPDSLLTSERRSTLLSLLLIAPVVGLGTGAHRLLTDGSPAQVAVAVAQGATGAALVLVALTPWCVWVVSKAWLALLGRVPWSLMEFLRDAHAAGLLQRYGGAYRFRHLRLQEHLASGRREEARVPAPREPSPAGAVPAAHRPFSPAPLQAPFTGPASRRRQGRADPAALLPQPQSRPEPEEPHSQPQPRPKPPPGPRDSLQAPPPLGETPGWRVSADDERAFAARGRMRRTPLAHWPLCAAFAALALMRTAAQGSWDTWAGWVSVVFWPVFALFINLVWLVLPRVSLALRIDPEGITVTLGRRSHTYAWAEVEDVTVRPVRARGRDQRVFGPHVRLRPGAAEPPRSLRRRDGWHLVLALNLRRAMPPDVVAALTRFSGGRWQG